MFEEYRNGKNDAVNYGVRILPIDQQADIYWRVIGIHHLTPAENVGKHNIFIDALDEQGNRISPPPLVNWTWEGKQPHQQAAPVVLDKPSYEPMGNISIERGMVISITMASLPSEIVIGLRADHADEGTGNSWGHHSFYVCFQRTHKQDKPTEPTTSSLTILKNGEVIYQASGVSITIDIS